ncbi:MAG: OmpW family outer membrane protein [Pseudomonadota bacterium]
MSGLVSKVAPGAVLVTVMGVGGLVQQAVAETGDRLLRVGISTMDTDSKSESFSSISGSGIELDDANTATITAAYFFADNMAVELTTGLPYQHDLQGNSRLRDLGIDKIAEVKSVSTTLGVQFYFPNETMFRPYAGVGGTYTSFYDEEMEIGGIDVNLDESLDYSLLVGADMEIQNNLFVNLDARYHNIDTTAEFSGAIDENIEMDVDPFVYTLGLGYRF